MFYFRVWNFEKLKFLKFKNFANLKFKILKSFKFKEFEKIWNLKDFTQWQQFLNGILVIENQLPLWIHSTTILHRWPIEQLSPCLCLRWVNQNRRLRYYRHPFHTRCWVGIHYRHGIIAAVRSFPFNVLLKKIYDFFNSYIRVFYVLAQ